jgi:lysophospholipase L1-like esterase
MDLRFPRRRWHAGRVQKAPRLVRARARQGRRWWEAAVGLTLGLLLVPLTAALTAAEDAPAVSALAAAVLPQGAPATGAEATHSGAASGSETAAPSAGLDAGKGAGVPAPSVQHVVGLGDSVPAGSACSCTDYVSLLAGRLGDNVTSTNLAVPGQTTSGLLDQLSSSQVRSALADADVVVVTIGANDIEATDPSDCDSADDGPQCYSNDLATLTQNLDRVAAAVAAQATRPGAKILLTGYWNVFLDGTAARAKGADYVRIADDVTREVNSRISSAAAAHGAVFVDLFTPFRGADGSKDCTPLLADDGDHPDAAGHAVIADALLAAL